VYRILEEQHDIKNIMFQYRDRPEKGKRDGWEATAQPTETRP